MAEGGGEPDSGESKPSDVDVVTSPAALAPGLHLVATPIGTARDITLRALDTLRVADAIAAEDTRTARRLMDIHGIPLDGRPLLPYHDHNGARMRPRILGMLRDGKRVAYVSDAGTPLVADPGYQLARAAIEAGLPVTAAPGPSAALAALSVSGLPSDRFLFAGFPPTQRGVRVRWIADLDGARATVIIFESPKRVHRLLGELCDALGEEREGVVCRELTKRFEDVRRAPIGALRDEVAGTDLKGECVILLGPGADTKPEEADIAAALRVELKNGSLKAAVASVAQTMGLPRREVYKMALELKDGGDD